MVVLLVRQVLENRSQTSEVAVLTNIRLYVCIWAAVMANKVRIII